MQVKAGEIANRIITVGSTSRAEKIAESMDPSPAPRTYSSDRGFTTISGYFNGIYVSVVAIGMVSSLLNVAMIFFLYELQYLMNGDTTEADSAMGNVSAIDDELLCAC